MKGLDNPKVKGVMGVLGKIFIAVTAVGAAIDVFAADKQAKKVDVLWKEHESKQNS